MPNLLTGTRTRTARRLLLLPGASAIAAVLQAAVVAPLVEDMRAQADGPAPAHSPTAEARQGLASSSAQ